MAQLSAEYADIAFRHAVVSRRTRTTGDSRSGSKRIREAAVSTDDAQFFCVLLSLDADADGEISTDDLYAALASHHKVASRLMALAAQKDREPHPISVRKYMLMINDPADLS